MRLGRRRSSLGIVVLGLGVFGVASAAFAQPPARGGESPAQRALVEMEQAAGSRLTVSRSPATGLVAFLRVAPGRGMRAPGGSDPEGRAIAFLEKFGAAFGVDPAGLSVAQVRSRDRAGMDHVRLRQVHAGVPVTGGEIVVHLRGERVVAVNGRALPDLDGLAVEPLVEPAEAVAEAERVLEKHHRVTDARLSEPRLEILNRGLLEERGAPTRLAWFVEATGSGLRQFIWVDARRGNVLLSFNQLAHARFRSVYDAGSTWELPGILVREEGQPATGDPDTDAAYDYVGDTYDYFLTRHGRDSYDGAGAPLISTVNFCPYYPPAFCPYENAFWDGEQMVYGQGFSRADDVTGHELTHAVTDWSARLFYYMQSGALNESFSDIFGEVVDLTNGAGNDDPAVRWQLGEDLPIGAIRNMMNPKAYGDPGKVSDPELKCQDPRSDGGGVHSNSGIPNHAFALMADGGAYNGKSVAGIGLAKAASIQYRVLTEYLVSASGFVDAYHALQQACTDLVGIDGITSADCDQVENALDAVEMGEPWPCTTAVPPLCPAGQAPVDVFADDLEDPASGAWRGRVSSGINHWDDGAGPYWQAFASSGVLSFWGFNFPFVGDSSVETTDGVALPSGARLQFNHSYGFESFGELTFDGGVIEYSTDGGSSWTDAGALVVAGAGYSGTIVSGFNNPLAGRPAFVGASWGYTASQLDLTGLAGTSTRFRFRMGTDDIVSDIGWFVDDVRVYTCVDPTIPTLTIDDQTRFEQQAGSHDAVFTVFLNGTGPVTVAYETADGTAVGGADYTPVSGTLSFPSGVTTRTIRVPILSDVVQEETETFFVDLRDPVGAVLGRGRGVGRIVNDDACSSPPLAPASTVGFVPGAQSVVTADLDSDGKLDLAVGGTGFVKVLRGAGDGRFLPGPSFVLSSGYFDAVTSLAAADFNGDGALDLVAANHDGGGQGDAVSLLLSDGTGGFAAPRRTLVAAGALSMDGGDLDGDGEADLAVVGGEGLSILLGTGTGAFDVNTLPAPGHSLAVGDLDGDGKADLAVACGGWVGGSCLPGVSILLGTGGGSFAPPGKVFDAWSKTVTIADVNGDGKMDLVVAAGSVHVLLGTGSGAFGSPSAFSAGFDPSFVAVEDFDRDGKADIAVVTPWDGVLILLRGLGGGSFLASDEIRVGQDPRQLAVGDYDGDGDRDIAVASFAESAVLLVRNVFATVAVDGPATVCPATSVASYEAAPGFGDYHWFLDGGYATAGRFLDVSGLAPGSHTLVVEAAAGSCRARGVHLVEAAPDLSDVRVSVAGETSACVVCVGGTLTATVTGGGGASYQWGFRTEPGGAVTDLAGRTTPRYRISGSDFPGPATYLLVVRVTPACGSPRISAEVPVVIDALVPVSVLSVGDATAEESDTWAVFTVVRSPSSTEATFSYKTEGLTASEGIDYVGQSETLTFLPLESRKEISVRVVADPDPEDNEAFLLRLSVLPGSNASIGRGRGFGTIIDDDSPGRVRREQAVWHPFFAVDPLETPAVGDFNGDGRIDIVTFTRQNPVAFGDVYVSLSTGDRFGPSAKWHDFFAINLNEQVVIADFDGDGKDDIATRLADTSGQVYVAKSRGNGLDPASVWLESIGFDATDTLAAGDVDGDGKKDLVLFARNQGKVYVALSTGDSFSAPTVWHGFFAVSTYERPRVADVTGDGKADIVTFASDSPTAFGDVYVAISDGTRFVDLNGLPDNSTKWHDFFAIRPTEEVRIGDLNGDGKDDFFTFLPPPFAQCYTSLSLGTAMGPAELWPELVAPDPHDRVHVGDVDGDGKADVLVFAQGEGKVYVSLAR